LQALHWMIPRMNHLDRKRIADEVIELLCAKLHTLPLPQDADDFDYESQKLTQDVTEDPLDIAEVTMDLEDAFGISFDDTQPGEKGLETIGEIIDTINDMVAKQV
ncbi:MAG: hypothetical protein ACOCXA_08515, partial [Planctomycetota bacterium]